MTTQYNNQLSKSGNINFRDYQHARKLYVDNGFSKAPKFGFQYLVNFNINPNTVLDKTWLQKGRRDVGLLVKKIDLPKFNIGTETLNQYNRRTLIQTKLTYNPISVDFHDDNSGITHNLWTNYFKYYFADSNYGDTGNFPLTVPKEFRNTKYGPVDHTYGRYDSELYSDPTDPDASISNDVGFFTSIDIYVLHVQREFTKFTLINPKITEWAHDSLDQSGGGKVMQNKMTVAYETVLYASGSILAGQQPEGWIPIYYDEEPSPYPVGGKRAPAAVAGRKNGFDGLVNAPAPVLPTALQTQARRTNAVISEFPTAVLDQSRLQQGLVRGISQKRLNIDTGFDRPYAPPKIGTSSQQKINPILALGKLFLLNQLNKQGLGKQKSTGYNIASGILGGVQNVQNPAGKFSSPPSAENQLGILKGPGGVGINLFKGLNTSVDGKIRANPAAILLPKR